MRTEIGRGERAESGTAGGRFERGDVAADGAASRQHDAVVRIHRLDEGAGDDLSDAGDRHAPIEHDMQRCTGFEHERDRFGTGGCDRREDGAERDRDDHRRTIHTEHAHVLVGGRRAHSIHVAGAETAVGPAEENFRWHAGIDVAFRSGMPTLNKINEQLDRLAALNAWPHPVLSLYLDLRPDQHGRDNIDPFLRKELPERTHTYAPGGAARRSLERDAERIFDFVAKNLDRSWEALAIFSCSAINFFETIPLPASPAMRGHRLFIGEQPHLYPVARAIDEYPRYVALLADTHSARLFVFAVNSVEQTAQVESDKTKRHKMGGWSQARYQRNVDNFRKQHAREVVEMLTRLVREEAIDKVLLAGDEVILPLLREEMPKDIASKIVDALSLDIRTAQRAVLEATLASLRQKDAESDRERVEAMIDAYRAGGLACVGEAPTRRAFELGQVEELLITANADNKPYADELIARARQTGAKIRFIEDAALLDPVGGVGAFLRFTI
jgi:peptide subunit release factor 1 (eRF1)